MLLSAIAIIRQLHNMRVHRVINYWSAYCVEVGMGEATTRVVAGLSPQGQFIQY